MSSAACHRHVDHGQRERHAASRCRQIVGPITSVSRWAGEVQTEQEWRVEIKTATDRVTALTEHIKAHHGYDVPEIIATPISGGSAEYLSWLVDETRG
jgi:periplasmic divalent cation tolerance protein